MKHSSAETTLSKLRTKLFVALGLSRGLTMVTGAFLLLGGLVLLWRYLHLPAAALAWMGALIVFSAIALVLVHASRTTPDPLDLRALLDRSNGFGGLFLAAGEYQLGPWAERLAEPVLPPVHWFSRPRAARLLLAAAFFAACLYAPRSWFEANSVEALSVDGEVNRIEEKLALLEQRHWIERAEIERRRQTLEEVARRARGDDPAKTWEALDHMNRSLDESIEEGLENLAKNLEEGQRLAQLAELLERRAAGGGEELAKARVELAALAQKLATGNDAPAWAMGDDTAFQPSPEGLTEERWQELSARLAKSATALQQQFEQLQENRLLDPASLQRLGLGKGADQGRALREFLAGEHGVSCPNLSNFCAADGLSSPAGAGGVTRGRGDAALTWTDEALETEVSFQAEVLPPGHGWDPEKTITIGGQVAAPWVRPDSGAEFEGLRNARGGQGGAFTNPVLPMHRGTVRRYFATGQTKQPR